MSDIWRSFEVLKTSGRAEQTPSISQPHAERREIRKFTTFKLMREHALFMLRRSWRILRFSHQHLMRLLSGSFTGKSHTSDASVASHYWVRLRKQNQHFCRLQLSCCSPGRVARVRSACARLWSGLPRGRAPNNPSGVALTLSLESSEGWALSELGSIWQLRIINLLHYNSWPLEVCLID